MYTQLLLVGYALLLIVAGFMAGMFVEQVLNKKQIEKYIANAEGFCCENCKTWESIFADHKDPDDALKELQEGNHCCECPICYANWYLDEEARWRGEK